MRGYPVYPTGALSASMSSLGRPKSRSTSVDYTAMGGYPDRALSPSGRPPSARPITPSDAPPMGYPEYGSRVPSVLRSPSRASSRQSFSQDPAAAGPGARPSSRASDRHRSLSLSLHAGSTPAMVARPLSGTSQPQVHRVPSATSINSATSRQSGGYQHYDRNTYVDVAQLASPSPSTVELAGMASPHTMANTRANAVYSAGPSRLRGSSPAMSYASLRD